MNTETFYIRRFPSLRANMGSWVYYVTAMPLDEVVARVKPRNRVIDNRNLHKLVQRALSSRVGEITKYLLEVEDRFFNAIVIGVEGGDPVWNSIDVGDDGPLGPANIDEETFAEFLGILEFDGSEKMFAIDGQHRCRSYTRSSSEEFRPQYR